MEVVLEGREGLRVYRSCIAVDGIFTWEIMGKTIRLIIGEE